MSLAAAFFARFTGLARAHGRYTEKGKTEPGKKQEGGGKTLHTPPTIELWDLHLRGEYGLGIVPICEDNTCVFGAIDVDIYKGLDFEAISKRLTSLELPLIPARTKSGGLHLYLFAREPVPAELMRAKLMDWAIYLGFSKSEIFPKQTRLASEDDIGNWINMPYFEGKKTNRYAFSPDGKKLTPEHFLKLSDMTAVTEFSLRDTVPTLPKSEQAQWEEAPPCLVSLSTSKFPQGSRNRALFNIGVYLRKRHGDGDWETLLDKYNHDFMSPPVPHREVQQIIKNVGKKDYGFTCGEEPICGACNRQVCLTRRFGIGVDQNDPGVVFGRLVKLSTTPPVWIWDVNGARIQLSTQELKDQTRFHSRAIEELNMWPNKVKTGMWMEIVSTALKDVEQVEVPEEASIRGVIWNYLEEYCTKYTQAKTREGLLQDKPYSEEERTYFRGSHFRQWLAQRRVSISDRDLWISLREHGATHGFWNIKGKGVNWWSVPKFAEQEGTFQVPNINIGDNEEM